MESWTAILLAYLLGGVTLLPLMIIAVLLHAHLTLPYREDAAPGKIKREDELLQPGDDLGPLKAALQEPKGHMKKPIVPENETAAGYYAVCREYTPMGINAKPIERSTPIGSTTVAAPSQSVYQTMYRSIFDRKQQSGLLDHGKSMSQRPKNAGNVFYVVLRHGHLMLFDDDEQLEVRHVISLAHHDVSIYSGGNNIPEGELFIKRNAICLSRRVSDAERTQDSQVSKPFYIFSENCSAKEDFYFALLRNQEQAYSAEVRAPPPLGFDIKHIINLVQKLHSSEEHMQSRWLNALIGRVFLSLYRTADTEAFIREKLNKKISRVKRPAYLSNIEIRKIDTGSSAPFFTNLRHRDLTVEGECSMEADVRYTGNFKIEFAGVARIDLGGRLKAREVKLVLSVALRKLEGHVLFKIKAPPSNRVWFSFSQMPKMEMTIEPIVSSRQITYTLILRQIEARIKEVVTETLVLPMWDDTPFFSTEHKKWRGGIFAGDDAIDPSVKVDLAAPEAGEADGMESIDAVAASPLLPSETVPMEKDQSLPVIDPPPNSQSIGFLGLKLSGRNKPQQITPLAPIVDSHAPKEFKLEAAPTSTDVKKEPLKHCLERSSSLFGEPTPTVGTEAVNADACKPSSPGGSPAVDAMTKLSARAKTSSVPGSPLQRGNSSMSAIPSQSLSSQKETPDQEINEDETLRLPRHGTASLTNSYTVGASSKMFPTPSLHGSSNAQGGSVTRGFFQKADIGTDALSTASTRSGTSDHSKKISLAAVTSAAGAAKRWGWNVLNRGETGKAGPGSGIERPGIDLSIPMGGGRPLPPPGIPLPMPDKTAKTTSLPASKRKPVPPPDLSERASTELREQEVKRRPVPIPPLPKRRRPTGDDPNAAHGEHMLVVEAPISDSEPTTPSEECFYRQPFFEDADEDDDGQLTQAGHSSWDDSCDLRPALASRDRQKLFGDSRQPQNDSASDKDEFSAW